MSFNINKRQIQKMSSKLTIVSRICSLSEGDFGFSSALECSHYIYQAIITFFVSFLKTPNYSYDLLFFTSILQIYIFEPISVNKL